MTKPVRWGVLGAARIALGKVVPGMQGEESVVLQAIASRDEAAARAAAERFGFRSAYGSYEALLADPQVDAVYIPLPNHLHVPWAIRALEAGKHVLCEKPIALNAVEAARLAEAEGKSGRVALEAFMVRQHPQWLRAREIVRSGALGTLSLVRVVFAYDNRNPADVRNQAEIGGGGLYDIGCYAIVAGRFLFGAEPARALSLIDRDPAFGTDRLTSGLLDFGGGRQLTFSVSTQLLPSQRVEAIGEKGRLEILIPFNAPQGQETAIVLDSTGALDGSGLSREVLPASDQYGLQAREAGRIFTGERAAEFPITDAVSNMRIIDALFRSEKSGAWETVSA